MKTGAIVRYALAAAFTLTAIYLVVQAPAPLEAASEGQNAGPVLPVARLFDGANAVNAAARQIYTARIVGGGLGAGLEFGEDWAEPGVDKGPLPALFLRLVAAELERRPPPLGLYLGSDAPINKSNLFEGAQAETFARVRATRAAVSETASSGRAVAMYPDFASARPCVTCHNEHPDSPRTDWKMDDVMGATTWTWPRNALARGEAVDATEALFAAVEAAYGAYLDRARGFARPPAIGAAWPESGSYALPDTATFMAEVRKASALAVLDDILLARSPDD